MNDAFSDVLDDDGGDSVDDDGVVTEIQSSNTFTDGNVRTTLPDDSGTRNDDRYEDPDGEGQADDVDPRKLFKQASLNELRYYAREGPYGRAIIKKPIQDVFKHGFDVEGDNTERADGDGKIADFLHEYEDYYKKAEIKARRDGMAVLMFHFNDLATSASEPITSDANTEWQGFQIWTVDNLSDDITASEVAEHTKYEDEQIYVTQGEENGGIALVDDIGHIDHGEIVGYGVEPRKDRPNVQSAQFVHADRCQHFTWGEHVDGPLGNNVTGEHVGESVLTPVLQPLKASQMGFWAMKNILYRYSAPLHAVEPPESWSREDFEKFDDQLEDISMSSDATLPPGSELSVAEGVSEFDPQPIYSTLIEAICAGTVFTKSVLQGTQSGTVSGSETDIKGYFNEIHNLRTQRTEKKFREAVHLVSKHDQSTIPRVSGVLDFDIDWGPLFKPSDIEQAEGMVSVITAAANGIKNYILHPEEARSLVEEQWAELDADVDLDELSEDELDDLDRINMNEAGQGVPDNEDVNQENVRENPTMQNGGGQPEGETRESSQPTREGGSNT